MFHLPKRSLEYSTKLLRFSLFEFTSVSHREFGSCEKVFAYSCQCFTCSVIWHNRFNSPGLCGWNTLLFFPPIYPELNKEVNALVSHVNNPSDFYIQLVSILSCPQHHFVFPFLSLIPGLNFFHFGNILPFVRLKTQSPCCSPPSSKTITMWKHTTCTSTAPA